MPHPHRVLLALLLAAACLLAVAAFLAALPALVRALPGRYAYYLPDPLQQWRHVPHPAVLPTPVPTPTPPPLPTPTPLPLTATSPGTPPSPPTALPIPTLSPTPLAALPVSHTLTGLRYEAQGWNNCGPATLAMALTYWGQTQTQREAAAVLKPDPEDKNVGPEEMAGYVRSLGLGAVVRVGGDLERLKRLVAAGFPVIVETWYVRSADDQLGHYRLIVGYDDTAQHFLTYDSLHGPDFAVGYQELDELWRVFNRVYLVVYQPEWLDPLSAVLGPDTDEQVAIERALEKARQEARQPPESCLAYAACSDAQAFAWFNVGSSLVALGQYEEAAVAFDQARVLGLPWRMLWYQFGPYQAYQAVGRYQEVISLADATLAVVSNLEESYYWRAMARLALGDTEGARGDLRSALSYHPNWPPAADALSRLED